jgi:hypothetical protein
MASFCNCGARITDDNDERTVRVYESTSRATAGSNGWTAVPHFPLVHRAETVCGQCVAREIHESIAIAFSGENDLEDLANYVVEEYLDAKIVSKHGVEQAEANKAARVNLERALRDATNEIVGLKAELASAKARVAV